MTDAYNPITFPDTMNRMGTGKPKDVWPTPPSQREKAPPQYASHEALHGGPTYGPHICRTCFGAGWFVNRHGQPETNPAYGQPIACTDCDRVANVGRERAAEELANLWQMSGLNPVADEPLTFEMFTPRTETNAMYDAFAAFASRPRGWLVVYGSPGTGKTHLCEALTRHLLNQKVPVLFMLSSHLWEYCGAVARKQNDATDYESRRRWVANIPILIIDDLGRERETEAVQEYRFEILDARYRRAQERDSGQTIITSNITPPNWSDYRLSDRAMDTRFQQVHVKAESYRRLPR